MTPPFDPLRPTLLLVDDEILVLKALQRALRKTPWNVLIATNRRAALDCCIKHRIDLVICDLCMPDCDGTALLATIHKRWPNTIRICISGSLNPTDIINAINQGRVRHYLTKPWDQHQLLQIISTELRQRLQRIKKEQRLRTLEAALTSAQASGAEAPTQAADTPPPHSPAREPERSHRPSSADTPLRHLLERYAPLRLEKYRIYWQMMSAATRLLNLSEQHRQHLLLAALFHELGKLPIPSSVTAQPESAHSPVESQLYRRYPELGARVFQATPELAPVGQIIQTHRETLTGSGFPSGRADLQIPRPALLLGCLGRWYEMAQQHPLPTVCTELRRRHLHDYSAPLIDLITTTQALTVIGSGATERLDDALQNRADGGEMAWFFETIERQLAGFLATPRLVEVVSHFLDEHRSTQFIDTRI